MARIEAVWEYPQYSPYSVLNVLCPAVNWTPTINHPLIKEFRVELIDIDNNEISVVGRTVDNYMSIPTDNYTIRSSYKIQIATITVDGRDSPLAVSKAFIASPLRFDFSTNPAVKLPSGEAVKSQRLLFLLF